MLATILATLLPTVSTAVDKIVPDKSMRDRLNAEITASLVQNEAQIKRAAADIVMSEAQGESWLQRNWRPMMMLFFAVLVGAYWFGYTPPNLSEARIADLFDLVQIGIGGYIAGRSVEKSVKVWKGGNS